MNDLPLTNPDPRRITKQIEHFKKLAAEGRDLDAEARLIDAIVPRNAYVLDAGCGFGRVAVRLHQLGHKVIGIDKDPEMISSAKENYPGPQYFLGDLADFNWTAANITHKFDAILCAGNVMAFINPNSRREALENMASMLGPEGRFVSGFGQDRGYDFGEFIIDAEKSGFRLQLGLESWDLRPFDEDSNFLVAVFAGK